MASRPHSSKRSFSSFWSDALPKVVNSCLLVCVLFNFVALFFGVKSSSPKVVHHVDSVSTNHFFVVTQYVASVSSPSSVSGLSSDRSPSDREISVMYHYMVVDGLPMIRYYGHNFSVGDLTSYGRIVNIYPDRVVLDGPLYLKNINNPDQRPDRMEIKNE